MSSVSSSVGEAGAGTGAGAGTTTLVLLVAVAAVAEEGCSAITAAGCSGTMTGLSFEG